MFMFAVVPPPCVPSRPGRGFWACAWERKRPGAGGARLPGRRELQNPRARAPRLEQGPVRRAREASRRHWLLPRALTCSTRVPIGSFARRGRDKGRVSALDPTSFLRKGGDWCRGETAGGASLSAVRERGPYLLTWTRERAALRPPQSAGALVLPRPSHTHPSAAGRSPWPSGLGLRPCFLSLGCPPPLFPLILPRSLPDVHFFLSLFRMVLVSLSAAGRGTVGA